MQTQQSKRRRHKKNYNPYGDDFDLDIIKSNDITFPVVRLDEILISRYIYLIDGRETWHDDRSEPEVEFEPEVEHLHGHELKNSRVLELLRDFLQSPRREC